MSDRHLDVLFSPKQASLITWRSTDSLRLLLTSFPGSHSQLDQQTTFPAVFASSITHHGLYDHRLLRNSKLKVIFGNLPFLREYAMIVARIQALNKRRKIHKRLKTTVTHVMLLTIKTISGIHKIAVITSERLIIAA